MLDGPVVTLAPSEHLTPSVLEQSNETFDQHHRPPVFRENTFGAVRAKRSPRCTFLVKAETIDSRSRVTPCVFATRAISSVTCSGLPARWSMSNAKSTCDLP